LKAVNRWIGEGGKATFVGAPDADILAAAIEILRKRIAAGTAIFLVKVKAVRGELANEGAGIIPVAKWLAKIKQRSDVGCRLCKRAQEQSGASLSTEKLLEDTYGHINSAFCNGMATTVTAASHFIWRCLYASMQAAQTPAFKLRFVTSDKESGMNTLWQEKEFEQICRRKSLTGKAIEIEKSMSLKEHERKRNDLDPTMFYKHLFWNRRPDGIVINKNRRTL